MTAVILAGGLGTRLSEETGLRPKPMVEIGGKPILWHIMKTYHHYGVKDFIICAGYKQEVIKQYFINYLCNNADIRVNKEGISILTNPVEDWSVRVVDTGKDTNTGGRLNRVQKYLSANEPFFMTYGDGVGDIDIKKEYENHLHRKCKVTMTVARNTPRFGLVKLKKNTTIVDSFIEKPQEDNYINAGYFVCNPSVFGVPMGDDTSWEKDVLPILTGQHHVDAYIHEGFWKPMDTMNDRNELEAMWNTGNTPWKVWECAY
jgi:glucose-1-phosphate cytidylyltransferase